MIEQYIYNKITDDSTLATLLANGSGFYLYPNVVPQGIDFEKAVTFTTIGTSDVYPNAKSVTVQFNLFADTHQGLVELAEALSDVFNEDNNQKDGGIDMVFSMRQSQSDLGYDYDTKVYQREATYYFKIR